MICLVPNIGSTSFKFRLLKMPGERLMAQGKIERIGQPGSSCADYPAAIRQCLEEIAGEGKPLARISEIDAIGFKAVHAGPLSAPQIIDDAFLERLAEFSFLAPAHNLPYIAAIRAFREVLPNVPLVAVIETGPYRWMNEASTTYSVPLAWRTEFGIRRYGFHGASHRAASEYTCHLLGENLRHISCHLGGSSSIAAFRDGVAVDASMGASPQSGLPQNNRVGDIDVFAVLHMMKKLQLGPGEMARVLNSQSGLAGISGTSGDIRDISESAASGDHRCRLALDVFVDAIRHYLGAYMVRLGGLDVITFSGGIGENSAEIRSAALASLQNFGIVIDEQQNKSLVGAGTISAANSRVHVLVVPANEESIVARETVAVVERVRASASAELVHHGQES